MCVLEVLCVVYGIITLVRGRFPVGKNKEVRGPAAYLVGVTLLLVLPVAIILAIVMNWDNIANGGGGDPFKLDAKTVLPDVIAVFGCGGLAMIIALAKAELKQNRGRRRVRDYGTLADSLL